MSGLATRLAGGPPILADGGTGTTLLAAGVDPARAPRDAIARVHRAFRDAGAELVLTHSFLAPASGRDAGRVVREALDAIDAAFPRDRPWIALSLGPSPPGTPEAARRDAYHAAIAAAPGDADAIIVETLLAPEDADAALAAARANAPGVPVLVSFALPAPSFGVPLEKAIAWIAAASPAAAGFNCGLAPDLGAHLVAAERLRTAAPAIPRLLRPAASAPGAEPASPASLAAFARAAAAAGVALVGGCCGATPEHVRAMAGALGL